MGRRVVKYDEVFDGKIETESKVMDLISKEKYKVFILADHVYSVAENIVGQRVKLDRGLDLYRPVKHENIVLLGVGIDLIKEIAAFGRASCTYFDEGIGFEADGKPVEYVTVTRNYIPGASDYFYEIMTCHEERAKTKSGGVYRREDCDSVLDLAIYEGRKASVDWSEMAANVSALWFHEVSALNGIYAFSNEVMEYLLLATRIYGPRALRVADGGICLQSLRRHFLHEFNLLVGTFCHFQKPSLADYSFKVNFRGNEIYADSGSDGSFLFRPLARYKYRLCQYLDDRIDIEYKGNEFVIPPPQRIQITARDLVFLRDDISLLMEMMSCAEEAVSNGSSVHEYEVGAQQSSCFDSLTDFPGYSECKSHAEGWICSEAGVRHQDLPSAKRLVELVTVAILVWKDVPYGEKADQKKCEALVGLVDKAYPSYESALIRLITLRSRKIGVKKKYDDSNAHMLVKRKGCTEPWRETSLPILIHAWKTYVFDRARTMNRQKRTHWAKDVRGFMESECLQSYLLKAGIDVILGDQAHVDIFL